MSDVALRLKAVQAAVRDACREAKRPVDSVELVAVSKRHPVEAIEAAYHAGQRVFGESYADELVQKVEATRHLEDIRFRFIGHLQRNKSARVVRHAIAVDSVDSLRLLRALGRHAAQLDARLEVLLQVQVFQEQTKSGIALGELEPLVAAAKEETALQLRGLMTLPPKDPATARRAFLALADAAKEHALPELSMGMSGDLAIAIACGSTQVRVGTAIFGPRPS